MPLLLFLCPVLFGIPFVTAGFARNRGRNMLLWCLLGYVLPFVSFAILWMLPDLSEKESA